jgi:hypothetical protein
MTNDEILEAFDYNEKLGRFKRRGTNKRAGYTNPSGEHEILIHGTAYLEAELVWLVHTGALPETPLIHRNRKITNNRFTNLCTATDTKEDAKQAKLKARADAKAAKQAAKEAKREAKREATEKRRAIAAERKAEKARAAYPKKTEARRRAAAATGMVQHEPTTAGLTHEALLKAIEFDERVGRFRYLPRADTEFDHSKFNRKYAGALAGDERENTYRTIYIKGKRYLETTVAWFYYKGEWPMTEIRHDDGDRLNIREGNLRVADQSITADVTVARKRRNTNNTTGYAGVTFCPKRQKFLVRVCRGGKRRYGGAFNDLHQAGAKATAMYAALGLEDTGA